MHRRTYRADTRCMFAPLAIAALPLVPLVAAQPTQTVVYGADPADRPAARTVSGSSWSAAQSMSTLAGVFAGAACRPSPIDDLLALLGIDENGRLTLRLRTDGSWGSDTTIEPSIGSPDAELADAAFEQRSGELLIVYRDGVGTSISYRVYDGTLYGAQSLDLGLPGAPVAVRLTPVPGADRVALVAASMSSLHAAVWDGSAWGDTVTLDSAYDGGAEGFDVTCETDTGDPIVCWARSTDTTLRVRRWDGEAWTSESSSPSVGAPVVRVALTPDRDAGSDTVLAAIASDSGGAEPLHAALWDGSAWSATTQLTADLEGTTCPFDAAWERQGGTAVVGWAEEGDTTVHARRWSGSGWGTELNAGDAEQPIDAITVANSDGSDARALVLARAREPGTATYFDYLAYSEGGSVGTTGVTYNGPTGENEPGIDPPPAPAYTPGGPDLNYAQNDTATLASGSYGTLTADKIVTVNLSTGQYVFDSISTDMNFNLDCDTSGGDVLVVIENGVSGGKNFRINRTGSYAVIVHLISGDLAAGQGAVIDAAVTLHDGSFSFERNATITGYLIASGNITFTSNSTVTPPTWRLSTPAYGSGTSATDRLWSVAISLGSPGTIAELTPTAGWSESSSLPFAVSEKVPERVRVRVARWREVQPD